MSAKKSWDIQPRARKPESSPQPSAAASARSMHDVRPKARPKAVAAPSVPVTKRNVTIARGKKQRTEAKEPLKKRRKKAKKALFVVLGIVLVLLIALTFVLAWQPMLRVTDVRADGPHAESVERIAREALYGTHLYVLPRNSLFFIPEDDIREQILAAHPEVEAVSIGAEGLTSLTVSTVARGEAFVWCGVSRELVQPCFSANAQGLIYAPLTPEQASSTQALRIFAPLEGQEGESAVRAHIARAEHIPEVLRFVKAMQTLGADIDSFVLRGDEADLYTEAGTRITYVLGREQEAAGIAASVFPQLALNDGTIQYVDLRFSGKAYFKRASEPEPAVSE
ncbi:MAG TPA: cell division protein FtsQ/DivIB [Candidatus Paceibacterota bacterium]|nr:cell division protein FtsQ/DivIB [Candidatus Paceibacterota bacterium]